METMLAPEEYADLIRRWRPFVRARAHGALQRIGRPGPLTVDALENFGLMAAVKAAEDAKRAGVSAAFFVPTAVEARLQDAIRQLQIGAVTANKVRWPDGS